MAVFLLVASLVLFVAWLGSMGWLSAWLGAHSLPVVSTPPVDDGGPFAGPGW
jgi:hypothetical protein